MTGPDCAAPVRLGRTLSNRLDGDRGRAGGSGAAGGWEVSSRVAPRPSQTCRDPRPASRARLVRKPSTAERHAGDACRLGVTHPSAVLASRLRDGVRAAISGGY